MKPHFDKLDRLFIDGAWHKAKGGAQDVINPANEAVIGAAPLAAAEDVELAIAAARKVFDAGDWSRQSPAFRATALTRFHDCLLARADELAEIIVAEAGAVQADKRARQIDLPLRHFRHMIDIGLRDHSRTLPPVVADLGAAKALGTAVVQRIPVGVVAAITAFNYPTYLNLAKLAPALMAGDTVVLKPSELTPFQALFLGEIAMEAELPAGVLNIVNGGVSVGEMLTADPRVDLVSFTGSDTVGALVAAQAASTLKRVLLELGGKSALIVREDGDLDLAVAAMLRGFTAHAGQGCGMFTRTLAHNSVRGALVARVADMASKIKVGDPADKATQMGPLISAAQRDRSEHYVQAGLDSGATLMTGGKRPPKLKKGYFFEPTLFDNVDNGSAIAQDEIFGPVGVVTGFDTDAEAVALANDSPFGLRSAIISKNVGLAFEMANEINVGHTLINGGALTALSELPFGGTKRSGYGREGGAEGYQAYTEAQAIEFHAG